MMGMQLLCYQYYCFLHGIWGGYDLCGMNIYHYHLQFSFGSNSIGFFGAIFVVVCLYAYKNHLIPSL